MKNDLRQVRAIVLGGGYSTRIKGNVPKQLAGVAGRPLLAYTLDIFEGLPEIAGIVLVANKKYLAQFQGLVKRYRYKKIERICGGGRTRQQSVFNALIRIKPCAYVLIHDGVRPFVSAKDIREVIRVARKYGAATSAVKTVDTIVEGKGGLVKRIPPRNRLWNIQTPQAFKYQWIYQAHQKAKAQGCRDKSDDAQLVMGSGKKVKLVPGEYRNFKVTTMWDMDLARMILKKIN